MLHKSPVRCDENPNAPQIPRVPHCARVPFSSKQGRLPAASAISKGRVRCEQPPISGTVQPMNAIAPALDTNDAVPVKERRISKRMRQVLTALATKGMTQREAARQAGMSETYLSAALRKPEIQVFIARAIRQTVAIGALRASTRLVELIDAGSEHVSADVSKHTLAIAGIKPTADAQVSVNIDIKAGYVIDLTDQPKPMRTIEHE